MKRFKHVLLYRVLAMLLSLATLLSLAVMPISAAKNTDVLEEGTYATITGGTKLYLVPNGWDVDGAWFAAYFYNSSSNAWVKMTKMGSGATYVAEAPSGSWNNVIFCRMNPAYSSPSWDSGHVWNQTDDLTYTSPKVVYRMNDSSFSAGTWFTYTVAGSPGLCGSDWTPSDTANRMTMNSQGLLEITYKDIAKGTYEFKVTDGSWTNSWGQNGGSSNYVLTLTEKSHVTITYNPKTHAITVTTVSAAGLEIYFDAALSKLSYVGSTTYGTNTIPVAGASVYCYYWVDGSSSGSGTVKMTAAPEGAWTDVYHATIPLSATHLLFYSTADGGIPSYGTCMTWDQELTDYVKGLEKPCFYADSSDEAIYSSTGKRSGYWDNAYTVRDAEAGRHTDVVDIGAASGSADADYYLNTTFYDWYSDYELNGYNRDDYTTDFGNYSFASHRNWVIFRQLNQALSDYYRAAGVEYPIYVGHFQPDEYGTTSADIPFSAIADTLNLYGYADATGRGDDQYRKFFAVNNSHLDCGTGTEKYLMAMQGLVNATLVNEALYSDGATVFPLFDEDFILGDNSKNAVLGEVYKNVQFPMDQRDYYNTGVAYYVFDSYETTLEMKQNSNGSYILEEVTGDARYNFQNLTSGSGGVDKAVLDSEGNPVLDDNGEPVTEPVYGFFPFNGTSDAWKASTYNYGFGTRYDISFKLTSDGMILNKNGEKEPIKFEFSGDDDVWVFIDGNLVLDIGGAHGAVTGSIDFAAQEATVYGVKYGGSASTEYTADEPRVTSFNLSESATHTLTMFYMERGMWESNMKLVFNISNSYPATLNVTKEVVDGADPDQVYTMKVKLGGSLIPVGTEYTVGSETRTVATAGQLLLKGGETASIVGIPANTAYEVTEVAGDFVTYFFGSASDNSTVTTTASKASGTLKEATAHYITVANAAADEVVVVDFGLPVNVTVENSDNAELYGLCTATTAKWVTSAPSKKTTLSGTYGSASISNGKICYTPGNMQMNGVDKIGYIIKYTKEGKTYYYYGTLTVVPATTIYYEDSFVSFSGSWKTDKSTINGTQGEDHPGINEELTYDANFIYGYDDAYITSTTHSMGSAQKVHVTAANSSAWPTATFTFTGTGFDVVSVTSNTTGFITCQVYQGTQTSTVYKSWVVDTYYGYTRTLDSTNPWIKYTWTYDGTRWSGVKELVTRKGSDASSSVPTNPRKGTTYIRYEENYVWTPATGSGNPLYQIPVIKSPELDYGTYTVVITPTYIPFFDHTGDGGYDFYMDAVRVYAPAQNMESYYLLDGEAYPQYVELRQTLLTDTNDNVDGISLIDGVTGGSLDEYEAYGPNNEIYLNSKHAVAFSISNAKNIANVHVGAKIFDKTATLHYAILNGSTTKASGDITVSSHTDLYYSISKDYIPASGDIIVLTNTGSSVLTLTNLKITFSSEPTTDAKLTINAAQTKSAGVYVSTKLAGMVGADHRVLPLSLGHSVSFESDLQMNYRIKLSDLEGYDVQSAYLIVEKDIYSNKGEANVETVRLQPDLTSDPSRMIFHLTGIQSVEMGSELRAVLYITDTMGRSYETPVDTSSILAYAQLCFDYYSYESQPELYRLLIDTLNYGAAAQTCFNRRTDCLVNAGMDAYQQYATTELSAELDDVKVVNGEQGTAVSKMGFTVNFADKLGLNAKLTVNEGAEITSVLVTDAEGNVLATLTDFTQLEDGRLQVTYSQINATQMRNMYYFTAYAGETAVSSTVGYSIEAYARSCIAGSDLALAKLVRNCMYYGDSAVAFFSANAAKEESK